MEQVSALIEFSIVKALHRLSCVMYHSKKMTGGNVFHHDL